MGSQCLRAMAEIRSNDIWFGYAPYYRINCFVHMNNGLVRFDNVWFKSWRNPPFITGPTVRFFEVRQDEEEEWVIGDEIWADL